MKSKRVVRIFKSSITVLIALLFQLIGLSQSELNQLTYNSQEEREAFANIDGDQVDYLKILMNAHGQVSSQGVDEAQAKVDELVSIIRKSGVRSKSPKKQSKFIYKTVHDECFRVYELENEFEHIFEDGRYNCVSASALYAIIFEKIGVPYEVVELPNHVYIMGWPKTEKLIIESTDPQNGIYVISDRDKDMYMRQLIDAKIIDKNDFNATSYSAMYDEYMIRDIHEISMRELVGVQYGNYAAFAYDDQEYEKSLISYEKALWLYPKSLYALMTDAARSNYLNTTSICDSFYVEQMIRWSNDTLNKEQASGILSVYSKILEQELYNRSDFSMFEAYSENLKRSLNDSLTRIDLSFAYHYEYTRILAGLARYEEALVQADSALRYKPENHDLHQLVGGCMGKRLSEIADYGEAEILLVDFETKHPTLGEDSKYQSLKAELLLRRAYQKLLDDELSSGLEYLDRFETTIAKGSVSFINEGLISLAYSEAIGIYFVSGNKSAARSIANRGLALIPNSLDLQRRKSMLR